MENVFNRIRVPLEHDTRSSGMCDKGQLQMYVADLENELIHQIQENQKIKSDAEVEMTVIVGS